MIKRIELKAGQVCVSTSDRLVNLYDVDECSLLDAVVDNFDITRIKQHFCCVKGPDIGPCAEDFRTS